MKINKQILYIIVLMVTFLQVYVFLRENKKSVEVSNKIINSEKSFKQVDSELNKIEHLKVLKLKKNDGRWESEICLNGNSKEINEALENLNGYTINNYSINGNGENFEVFLQVYR